MKLLKKTVKWVLALLLIAALTLFILWWIDSPEDFNQDSASLLRLEAAEYDIDRIGIEIIDTSRSTPAMGKFEGDDKRTLKGSIWLPDMDSAPKSPNKHPLIVFSHGFSSYHQGCRHIAQYLARNGYIVAAVDFPLSNAFSPAGSPQLLDVANQPGDVSALIDHIFSLNTDSQSKLYQRVDEQRIGAMGLSLGGLTTALLGFHPDLKDDRIDAVAMFAPPLEAFSGNFFATRPELPSMLISGSYDRIVPEQSNANAVQAINPNGWFVSLKKGTHLGFANVGSWLRWTNSPDDLGCALMERNLEKLTLPDRWSDVIANTNGILLDVAVGEPCPEINDRAMNASKQQWLTRVATGAFFDMHLRSDEDALSAEKFLRTELVSENPSVVLRAPL